MDIEVSEESPAELGDYAQVPIAFEVNHILDVSIRDNGLGGISLSERALAAPYIKDYDAIEGEGPSSWAHRFDMSNWGILVARSAGRRVGGAVIAYDTANFQMLEGRSDLAVLWDLRVAPDMRGQGVGHVLFTAIELWSLARGCRQLKAETQNINLPACRFYARQGCMLGAINRFAYPELPREAQLIWYKDLSGS